MAGFQITAIIQLIQSASMDGVLGLLMSSVDKQAFVHHWPSHCSYFYRWSGLNFSYMNWHWRIVLKCRCTYTHLLCAFFSFPISLPFPCLCPVKVWPFPFIVTILSELPGDWWTCCRYLRPDSAHSKLNVHILSFWSLLMPPIQTVHWIAQGQAPGPY